MCTHLENFTLQAPDKYVCEECEKIGGTWLHLRKCQECGVTLCCDSSPNKHASKHAHSHNHPVAISAEPNEFWAYCYVDKKIKVYKKRKM